MRTNNYLKLNSKTFIFFNDNDKVSTQTALYVAGERKRSGERIIAFKEGPMFDKRSVDGFVGGFEYDEHFEPDGAA